LRKMCRNEIHLDPMIQFRAMENTGGLGTSLL